MRSVATLIFVLAACTVYGQQVPTESPNDSLVQLSGAKQLSGEKTTSAAPEGLPESPGTVTFPASSASESDPGQLLLSGQPAGQGNVVVLAKASFAATGAVPQFCGKGHWMRGTQNELASTAPSDISPQYCVDVLNPYVRFLDTRMAIPMTPAQKGYLAFRNLSDPFNLGTIAASSAITIGFDSRTAYGPGIRGFGKIVGVTLLQDATGEFFGTFLIPSLAREDPHYHRMPQGTIPRRILHAASRTIIAQHDDGSPMLNYSTLLTYPIASEISNLYVPGIQGNGESTAIRILTGYALDPVNNLVTEFLPDVAKHIHIRIIFVQQILNQVVSGPPLAGQGPQ